MTDERRRPHDATETVALGVAPPSRPTAVLSTGTVVADRYEVRGVLGSGGFAVVYLAGDRESGDEVALKVLRPERVGEKSLRRLRREAEIANRAACPHLVRVRDVGLDGDDPYLALERVHGRSLAQRMDGEPLPLAEVLDLARGILAGLAALHDRGVLHRDVKPGNVLLADDGRVMLADFGLSLSEQHAAETRATAVGSVVGTVEYLSPEQALAEEVDPRSDLYSFGVVLFEMLTGRLPHSARSPLGTLVAHIQQPAPDVRGLRPEVPPWLAAVVARLLAKKPEQRYPSAAAVARDLERRRASGRGVGARLRRFGAVARRRAPVLSALAAALAAAVLLWVMAGDGAEPAFSHVRQSGDALHGIGENGEVLWTLPDTHGHVVTAKLKPGEPTRLVGFPKPPNQGAEAQPVPLSILDAATGEVVRQVELPTAAEAFDGLSNRYGAHPDVLDLDGDGFDEVIVQYGHTPYWPSYTVLYEPRIERSRVVLMASGHHRLAGRADVDGDGDGDLLFVGHANRMGWYMAAAAVALDPPVNQRPEEPGLVSASPDHAVKQSFRQRLLWYALLPRTVVHDSTDVGVDPAQRRITFRTAVGADVVLSFDGFPAGRPHALAGAERNAARRDAYWRLREARRLLSLGQPEDGLTEVDAALRLATRAGDPLLVEWARRTEVTVLVRAGRGDEAAALARELSAGSDHAPEIAFDVALAFHLGGDPERAAAWYRTGLGPGGSEEVGRGRYEYLHGLALALLEQGRVDEALSEMRRYGRSMPDRQVAWTEAFVRWRTGRPRVAALPARDGACGTGNASRVDLNAYLACELALQDGADPASLLPRVDLEIERSSETVAALLALRALLLHRLGRHREADAAARRAWDRTSRERADNLYAHALADLVAERHALVTGEPPAGVGG